MIIKNYTFNVNNGTVTFDDYNFINVEKISSIVNLTRGKVLYNSVNKNLLGTVGGNISSIRNYLIFGGEKPWH